MHYWLNLTATKMTMMTTMTTMTSAQSQVNSSNPDSTDTLEDNTAAFSLPVRVKTDLRIRGYVLFLISLFPHRSAFPDFLISSPSCFSSFPYFLIIVLFPPQHSINSLLSHSFLLRVQTFISSFIPALFFQIPFETLFMVFEINSSSDLFQSGNSALDPKRISKSGSGKYCLPSSWKCAKVLIINFSLLMSEVILVRAEFPLNQVFLRHHMYVMGVLAEVMIGDCFFFCNYHSLSREVNIHSQAGRSVL